MYMVTTSLMKILNFFNFEIFFNFVKILKFWTLKFYFILEF
jgi:hypothetical protein